MSKEYKRLTDTHGYHYYMTSDSILKKSTDPMKNAHLWILSNPDSFYKLLTQYCGLFYYIVFLDPKDAEIHEDNQGIIYAESVFIEEGPCLLSDFQGWDHSGFCRQAVTQNSNLIKYVRSRDPDLYEFLRMNYPMKILEINETSKVHIKWKIDIIREHPYFLETYTGFNDTELHNMILTFLPEEYIKYIKNPDRKTLKKIFDRLHNKEFSELTILKTYKIPDTEFIIPYIKKRPLLIFALKDPTYTMYETAAFVAGPLILLQFPLPVTLRILFNSCGP